MRLDGIRNRPRIGVIGGNVCDGEVAELARRAGRAIAEKGAVLLCGGLGGVMEAAARGAREAGGFTIGILPGEDPSDANPFIDLPITTGFGHARNLVLVRSCDGLVAVDGAYGTLSEISFGLLYEKPIAGIRTWSFDPRIEPFEEPEGAVASVLSQVVGTGPGKQAPEEDGSS